MNHDLIAQYNLAFKKMQYCRSNYYLETQKEKFLLRRANTTREQIAFEYEVNEQMISKGFSEIEPLYLTKKNVPYAVQNDKFYVLQKYRDVEEIDFRAEEDLKQIIGLLARFHKGATCIESKTRSANKIGAKNIYNYFEKRTNETKKIKHKIENLSKKSKFERMFCESYRTYQALEEMALGLIDEEIAVKLIEEAKKDKTVAHNEYTYHAIGKNNKGEYIINHLDYCGYNIQILDLSNVLTKVMQKNNWDIALLERLIGEYTKERSLSIEEYRAVKALLIFPEKFASICFKYLNSKNRNHYTMFEMKWENMLIYKEEQLRAAQTIEKYL